MSSHHLDQQSWLKTEAIKVLLYWERSQVLRPLDPSRMPGAQADGTQVSNIQSEPTPTNSLIGVHEALLSD